jgi:hypothetical protein
VLEQEAEEDDRGGDGEQDGGAGADQGAGAGMPEQFIFYQELMRMSRDWRRLPGRRRAGWKGGVDSGAGAG